MQSRHYTAPRSPLSPHASLNQVEANLRGLPTQPARYTDEQQLALRAWSSGKLRQAPLVEQVETLRHYPGLEPVYGNLARVALHTKSDYELGKAATALWAAMWRKHEARQRTRQTIPLLADLVLA